MKPVLTRGSLAASFACLAGCGLFGPTEASKDAGRARPAPSATAEAKGISLATGQPFDGEITMTINRQGRPPVLRYYDMTGDHVRVSTRPPEDDTTYTIVDTSTWKAASVSDPKKTVTLRDLGETGKKLAPAGVAGVVAGYSCDIYRVDEDNGDKTEACLARGVRFPALDPTSNAWLADLGRESFPLRVVVKDASGNQKSRMEVTKIEPTTFPGSLFVVPSGYKSVGMHDLIKGGDAAR